MKCRGSKIFVRPSIDPVYGDSDWMEKIVRTFWTVWGLTHADDMIVSIYEFEI
jgi:hypothetical protein